MRVHTDVLSPVAPRAGVGKSGRLQTAEAIFEPTVRIGPAEVEARRRLLSVFDGLEFFDGDQGLRCDAAIDAPDGPTPPVWMRFQTSAGPIGAAVLWADGRAAAWPATAMDTVCIPVAVAAMARLEFVIQALETLSGLSWRPVGLGCEQGRRLRLDLRSTDGDLAHRMVLSLPDAAMVRLSTIAPAAPDLSRCPPDLPLVLTMTINGPLVPVVELAELRSGDLVWLGGGRDGRLQARLGVVASGARSDGVFDPARRSFQADEALRPAGSASSVPRANARGETNMRLHLDAEAADPAAAGGGHLNGDASHPMLQDLSVQLKFEIGEWSAPLGEIARLAPGCVIPAPPGEGDVEVRITIEGRAIARGRLVAVGQGYGVLVESMER